MATRNHNSKPVTVHQSTGKHKFVQSIRHHTTASSTAPGGANGHWGLSGVNEVQKLIITGSPTGGTFTLSFDGSGPTAGIAFNADAPTIKTALETLGNIAPGDIVVTPAVVGGVLPTSAMFVEFKGVYLQINVAQMTANSAGLTGGAAPTMTVSTIQAGSTPSGTINPTVGRDDQLSTTLFEAEAVAIGNIGAQGDGKVGRLIRTGTVVIPTSPAGSEEGTRAIWKKNVFGSRIPGLSQS